MKYALLIGINYTNSCNELRGCINDAVNMKKQLIDIQGYKEENITVLTDNTDTKPTKHNILTVLKSFSYLTDITELFFHFSGHGSNFNDKDGDETDKKDECIITIDDNYILDDELKIVFDKINTSIFCLFDCCHSGTAMDLGYQYKFMSHKWEQVGKTSNNNHIIMISGCTDKQTSADAYINNTFQGAMTHSYLDIMKRYQHSPTLLQLIIGMRNILRKGNFKQLPQLNSNKIIDIKTKWLS